MKRILPLLILLSWIILSQAAGTAAAAKPTPKPTARTTLKAGAYSGTITISGRHHFSETGPGVERNDFTLKITESVGKITIQIGSGGTIIGAKIDIPISFTLTANLIMEKTKDSLPCRGHSDTATGKGTVTVSFAPHLAPIPIGEPFSMGSGLNFTLDGISPKSKPVGSKCPKYDYETAIRNSVTTDLGVWFTRSLNLSVNPPTGLGFSGGCDLEDWGNDPDRAFSCWWSVHPVPNKK